MLRRGNKFAGAFLSAETPRGSSLVERRAAVHDESCKRFSIPLEDSMKRVLCLLLAVFAFAAIAASAADSTKITGWISDSMCGAKHAGSGAACVKKCIDGGMSPVFVDEGKKAVWTIDNPDAVKGHYGDKVSVMATVDNGKKSVHIDSIATAE
jgi:hypothetical protein